MVFYFASPKYNPLINKVLTETDQVIAESIVGNDLFLKKTMKDKLASIASIDIIIVDFTALADTDAEIMEAVESIRIMDYKVRFIFVMPYKAEGDPFLKECFYAGIYDLIISDQYLEISEQLAVCVTDGMRYKDALKYRDAAINDQPKEAAISRKTMIGIAGAGIRSGATHNSIVLGNFLRANNQMTAVLEYAQRPALQSVCEATGASFYNEGYFSLKGVDYYPECDRERLTAVAGRLYDYIIMDFGNYADADQILFNKCDVTNKFFLYLQSQERLPEGEIPDPRWATFKQIQDAGWKVKKGAKGFVVELWKPYDFESKREISWKEYIENHLSHEKYGVITRNYYVFNGRDIEGIPELQPQTSKEIVNDELIDKIQKGMDLQILNDGGDRAYYSPKTDSVHLPEKDTFYNSYAYNATALHELSHATGAEKRLNRDIRNVFGTEKYAYEELVAEISACFMSEHIQIEQTEEHVNNHKAYIQSWTKALSEKPEMLMKAIRDAEKAANYLEYHAEILSKEEYQETLTLHENEETPTPGNTSEKMVEKTANPITREADLKANGYKLTPALKKHMDRLDQLTGRKNSVKDIYKAYKTHDFHGDPETEKTIKSIGKIFQRQEMQIKAVIPER